MEKEKWQRLLLVVCGVSALAFGLTFGATLCHFNKWHWWTTYNCIGTVGAGLYCLYASVKGLFYADRN